MRKIVAQHAKCFIGISWAILTLAGCDQRTEDQSIKADITVKAKEDVNFAGVKYTVDQGVVNLFGSCATPKSKALVLQKLRSIHVIDSIADHLQIAPVQLGPSFSLRQEVDSVLSKYPSVTATVSGTSVVLIGKLKKQDLQKLRPSVEKVYSNVSFAQLTIEK